MTICLHYSKGPLKPGTLLQANNILWFTDIKKNYVLMVIKHYKPLLLKVFVLQTQSLVMLSSEGENLEVTMTGYTDELTELTRFPREREWSNEH